MSEGDDHPTIDGMRAVVDKLDTLTEQHEVSVQDIVSAFGEASFLPLMMIPAVLVVSPLSGIPLFSSLCGITIGLIAIQMVARRSHVGLPGFVMRRKIKGEKLHSATRRLRSFADWIDRHARKRLSIFLYYPFLLVPQLLCVVCGFSMPFLELLPFSSSLLGAAVCLMAVGFLVRDGLYILGGLGFVGVASIIPFAVTTAVAG